MTQEEAARLLGVCERTFRRHIGRYQEEGIQSSFRGVLDVIVALGLFSAFVSDRGSHYWTTACFFLWQQMRGFPSWSYRRYTQAYRSPSFRQGERSEGFEATGLHFRSIKHPCMRNKPSMALDSGIHAGMTVLLPLDRTCV